MHVPSGHQAIDCSIVARPHHVTPIAPQSALSVLRCRFRRRRRSVHIGRRRAAVR
jgi:hypothetical protein